MAKYNVSKDEQKEAIAEFLLRPFRLVRDPVHGDIWLTRLESAIVDQPLFQRLRGIRQLAVSHLVYPGALHTRFDHSLGTLFVADKIAREAKKNCGSRGYLSDLNGFYPIQESDRLLIRLTALLHDAAHFPFGHLVEDEAGFTEDKQWADEERRKYLKDNLISNSILKYIKEMQEEFVPKRATAKADEAGDAGECDSSCRNAFKRLARKLLGEGTLENNGLVISSIEAYLKQDVEPELLDVLKAEEEGTTAIQDRERPFIAEAVGDTICADLLDYLARDAHFTGIEERYDRRIYTYFVTFKQGNKPHMGLLIKKGSKGVRIDAARYIVKLLDMRYALAQMVYTHPAKRAFSALAASMFGSWVMYKLHSSDGADMELNDPIEPSTIQEKAKNLILQMITDNELNTDDALLTTLMALGESERRLSSNAQDRLLKDEQHAPSLMERQWMERTAALARAIKYREKWRGKRMTNFDIEYPDLKFRLGTGIGVNYDNPHISKTLTALKNLTGQERMRIEEELERLIRKLYIMKGKQPSHAALIALHVPKVFKPKEADVNVVLVHDSVDGKEAYAGPFKYLEGGHWDKIRKVNGRGSLSESDPLKRQAELLGPMLGVLTSTSDATVKLTVAEYYLHPEADKLLKEIGVESEFTEIVEIMVALRRYLADEGGREKQINYKADSAQDYYKRYEAVLEELAKKVGAKYEPMPELAAAHAGAPQIPTDLRPADRIGF